MDIIIIAHFCLDFSSTDNGRFSYLGKLLSETGHQVEIITTKFSHATKTMRNGYTGSWPFKITFLDEPGYSKNISLKRFYSHFVWGNNVRKYLNQRKKPDAIYCAIPSLTGPYFAAKFCEKNNIKYVIDVQDIWPEAFKMVFHIPVISDLLFAPFSLLANGSYKRADEIIAVSQTYVDRAMKVNRKCDNGYSIFLGTDLRTFDENVKNNPVRLKSQDELWLGYCGTLGASYDLTTVFDALRVISNRGITPPKFIVMGSGLREAEFKKKAKGLDVEFTGKLPYPQMCGVLAACDIVVNPIKHNAAQSIINKHADYAASGLPVINTQDSKEYRKLITDFDMGFSVSNGNPVELADYIEILCDDANLRKKLGNHSRKCAEQKFDRANTYEKIIEIIT